jgi:hypothetical protein
MRTLALLQSMMLQAGLEHQAESTGRCHPEPRGEDGPQYLRSSFLRVHREPATSSGFIPFSLTAGCALGTPCFPRTPKDRQLPFFPAKLRIRCVESPLPIDGVSLSSRKERPSIMEGKYVGRDHIPDSLSHIPCRRCNPRLVNDEIVP